MTDALVFVKHKGKRVKIKYTDFDNLIQKTKEKFKFSTDICLEYQEEDGGWTAICDDEDLENLSSNKELRVVLEEENKNESFEIDESDKRGRKHKRSQSISGEEIKAKQNVFKNDNVKGDKLSGTNATKVETMFGDMYINDGGNASCSTSKPINPEEACGTYKWTLLEDAQKKAIIRNTYSGRKVSIAKLQITSTEQQNQNKEGVYLHHRADRAELMSRQLIGDVEVDNLFERAKELAKLKSLQMDFQNTPNARENFIKEVGNLVIISGQAGSGKTTLSKTVLGRVVGGERLFGFDYVFYLPLREVDKGKKVSILRFLAPTVSCDNYHQKAILNKINISDKVLIILDGLDESNIDFTTPHQPASIDDEATAEVFIKNLLKGSILPNAKKLIFSRPRTIAELPDQYKPMLVATILGLNEDAQLQICNDICKENSQKVYQYIKSNPILSAYCQTPLNLILAAHALNETAPNDSTEIRTFTDVLTFTLQWFVKNKKHRRGNFDVKSISSLAWNGFKKDAFTFTQKDFNKDFNKDDLFISINETTELTLLDGDPEIKVFFSHLVLQEFFAAVHLLYFMELEEFLENGNNFISTKFEIVTKIMFGLCNEKTNEKINKIVSHDFYSKEKVDFLKSLVELKPYSDIDDEALRYILWAYELNTNSFTQNLVNCLSDEVRISCRMLPSDFAAFHYVCEMRQQQFIIFRSLSNRNFYGDFWHQFLLDEKLQRYVKKIGKLILFGNKISDKEALDLVQCFHIVQILHLGKCILSVNGWKTVFNSIANMNEKMERLALYYKEVSDDEALDLAHCIQNIQGLYLKECSLTAIGWKTVFGGIANMNEKMEQLRLIDCEVDDEGALALAECIHSLQRLHLNRCSITAIGLKTVFSGIANMNEKMEELLLNHNEIIDDEAVLSLSECIHNLQRFYFVGFCLTGIGWKTVFTEIANMNEKMEELMLNRNLISDETALALSQCVHNVQRLCLNEFSSTAYGYKTIFSGIANMNEKMERLRIYHLSVNDETAVALSQCIHNVQSLHLCKCFFTTIGWKTVFSGIANMNEKMNELIIECDHFELHVIDELVEEYKTRLESKVTNLRMNIKEKSPEYID